MPRCLLLAACLLAITPHGRADERKQPSRAVPMAAPSVEQLVETVRKSVVVITVKGRDGKRQGLGTGFAIGPGLIATNYHVIGEARPITVETADGALHDVAAIHASDRTLDLAVLRLEGMPAIPSLKLAPSGSLKQGQPVVVLGNPHGLKHSVVTGVVSGTREIAGRSMIQLAIPVEPGNSGGPLIDLTGEVHGIITLKSAIAENLGFAVPVAALAPLLKKPNPVPMARWLTLNSLDPTEWKPIQGARWRQRGGRIQVEGAGEGFGGRALCLWQQPIPETPVEISVSVRLDDEHGAAGLVFHADGPDKHYGFYPSGGQLRLTRFNGPDVFSWTILAQVPSTHYHAGEWNNLKVQLAKGSIRCFVNDQLAIESTDDVFSTGQAGLAKFRDTQAEFKSFQVAKHIAAAAPSASQRKRMQTLIGSLPDEKVKPEMLERLAADVPSSVTAIRDRARQLEEQAGRLRRLATEAYQRRVLQELHTLLNKPDTEIDLVAAALQLARLDNEELDPAPYRREIDRMAREITAKLPAKADENAKLMTLRTYLFEERGFHGSRADYYNRSNSYLNDVLDDREGLPITLSLIYLELARRLGVPVVGIGLPGHFVVQHQPVKGKQTLIDVYEGAVPLSREEAERKVLTITGRPLRDEHLAPVSTRAILARMLQNLLGIARNEQDLNGMLRYLDAILTVTPDAAEEHWLRALCRYQDGQKQNALDDVSWLLEHQPDGIDLDRVQELRRVITRSISSSSN